MGDGWLIAASGNAVAAVIVAVVIVGVFGAIGGTLTLRRRRRRDDDRESRGADMATWAASRGWSFVVEEPSLTDGRPPGFFELENPAKANRLWARDVAVGSLAPPGAGSIQVVEWERTRYIQTYNPNGGTFTHTVHDFCGTARVTFGSEAATIAVVPKATKKPDDDHGMTPPTGNEDFDAAYRVVAPDTAGVAMLTPEVIQWQNRQSPGIGWQINEGTLEVWAGGYLTPAVAVDLVERAGALLGLLGTGSAGST